MVARQLDAAMRCPGRFFHRQTGTGEQCSPSDCRKRCAHPLAPSARGLRPQAVGERTVRLSEIFRAMARFSPSAPSGHLPRRGRFFDTLGAHSICARAAYGRCCGRIWNPPLRFFVLAPGQNSTFFIIFYLLIVMPKPPKGFHAPWRLLIRRSFAY